MPTLPVPIFRPVYRGVDGVELSDDNFYLMDGYRSQKGGTVSRPGSSTVYTHSSALGVGIDGLHYWQDKDQLVLVSGGEIVSLNHSGGVFGAAVSNPGTRYMLEGQRVSFAGDGTNLFLANGGRIVYISTSGTPAYLGDTDAPGNASHIAYLDTYILSNNIGSNRFYWSNVGTSSDWSALNFASAVGNPDPIVALHVFNREIYLFGKQTIEIWENDGNNPFSRIPGGFIQSGCSAPHSVVNDDNYIYWFDHERRFVRFNGKTVERLSTPYDREVQGFSTVADCYAVRIPFESNNFIVFNFPAANRSLVFNQTVDEWGEWGKWISARGEYDRWIGGAYVYAEPWGKHIIGRRDKAVLAEFSRSYLSDDGEVIRLARLTGHVDFGTLQNKRSNEFRIRARRGDGLSGSAGRITVRFKDNGRYWSQPRTISLGSLGEYDMVARLYRTGIFRTRQYEFIASDAVPVVFTAAEEDIEVLR